MPFASDERNFQAIFIEMEEELTFLIATAAAAIISDRVICGTDCVVIDGVAGRTAKHLIIFTTHR